MRKLPVGEVVHLRHARIIRFDLRPQGPLTRQEVRCLMREPNHPCTRRRPHAVKRA